MRTLAIAIPFFLASAVATAQVKTPQPSPAASVSQTIGVSDVTVTYHRPAVRGREIWGKLVPFGEVWRAGANECTTIAFSDDVMIGDAKVPAGKYSFFVIPARDEWTLVLNKNTSLWGSIGYKDSEDLVRWKAKPESAEMTEWLTYSIVPEGKDSGIVTMQWEKSKVSFKFTVDFKSSIKRSVEATIASLKDNDASGFYNAANAYFEAGLDLQKACEWNDKARSIRKTASNAALRGKIMLKMGKKAEAAEAIQEAIQLATERKAPPTFIDELKGLLAEAGK
jgi:hypothetical protein